VKADVVTPIVDWMIERVPADDRDELRQDPLNTIRTLWPDLQLVPLAGLPAGNDDCSCDGYYDTELVPGRPNLVFATDPSPRRVRFTLLHELGHHIIRTAAPELLDLIDDSAGDDATPDDLRDTEEHCCHTFAGTILVPASLLAEVIGAGQPRPDDVHELYKRSGASWEATAVGIAGRANRPTAIILVRAAGTITFCASSPGLRPGWRRQSRVQPHGALDRALELAITAKSDLYRYGLSYERSMWCDVRHPYSGLAVAVLSDTPSNGQVNLLPEATKPWERDTFCERCGGARTVGWCDQCVGKRCEDCGECGCYRRAPERLCEGPCMQLKGLGAFTSHDTICNDCLAI
jgi:hypothetical protein